MLVPASEGCREAAAFVDSSSKLADSENSTSASVASSPRSSSRQSAAGSPQQSASQGGEEEEVWSPSKRMSQEPGRPLRLISCSWESTEQGQLSVREDDFVRVWPNSETDLGWIYAENPFCSSAGGWLPTSVLAPSSKDKCWMIVQKTMPALHLSQLSIQEGDFAEVSLASCSEAGWIYARRLARRSSCKVGAEVSHIFAQAGWVPTSSLAWEDAEVLPKEVL